MSAPTTGVMRRSGSGSTVNRSASTWSLAGSPKSARNGWSRRCTPHCATRTTRSMRRDASPKAATTLRRTVPPVQRPQRRRISTPTGERERGRPDDGPGDGPVSRGPAAAGGRSTARGRRPHAYRLPYDPRQPQPDRGRLLRPGRRARSGRHVHRTEGGDRSFIGEGAKEYEHTADSLDEVARRIVRTEEAAAEQLRRIQADLERLDLR